MAIRPERFGGLVYRCENRRLFFLHSHELVDFVRELDGVQTLRQALDAFISARGLPESAQATIIKSLSQLQKLKILDSP
ncbi:MAG: mycofactocin biosynthesis chaperone MftB [Candidatus Competibacteraceae bacterium]